MSAFIQVGFTAMRDPATGAFLPSVPLYIEATEGAQKDDAALTDDIAKLFAQKMKQYMDATGEAAQAQ